MANPANGRQVTSAPNHGTAPTKINVTPQEQNENGGIDSEFVIDRYDAPHKVNVDPSNTSTGGTGTSKVVDHIDAPFKTNIDPNLQSDV